VTARELPSPTLDDAVGWTRTHLGDLACDDVAASTSFTGGQASADSALATYDVRGYAAGRNQVLPVGARGASRLSPYVRHGLLTLPRVWDHVGSGPARDVAKFRDELLWQEYARHLYARTGGTSRSLRYGVRERGSSTRREQGMACLDLVRDELMHDGWLVNQTRMWFASHWTVRLGNGWRDGEDHFFAHLLDGSRAANRLGWQWTVGAGTGKPYGFSRWQVEKRAPALCGGCELRRACPVEGWPDDAHLAASEPVRGVARDLAPETTRGPAHPVVTGRAEAVWITAESLGDDDPALVAHPDLPAVFVFDEPLLARLALSGKRLVFLAQTLADLAERREVRIMRGDPAEALDGLAVATTYAPVPGWRSRASAVGPVSVHPWPWLVEPHAGSASSFTAWRRGARV
jgi:deoxyribodipyrimidine photo-lyase